jgi:hypothetical protein
MARTYSQEEVDAILDRALRAHAKDGTRLTHEELVAAAAEVGIPKEAIDSAARDLDAPGAAPIDAAIVAGWKKRARLRFVRHLVTYLLVNAMLAFINVATGAAFLWFPIVMLGWGIGLAMHLMSVLFADEERVVTRERHRIARRERRARWRRRSAEFERAVEQGVRALLDMANTRGARVDVPPEHVRVGEREPEPIDEDEPGAEEMRRRR